MTHYCASNQRRNGNLERRKRVRSGKLVVDPMGLTPKSDEGLSLKVTLTSRTEEELVGSAHKIQTNLAKEREGTYFRSGGGQVKCDTSLATSVWEWGADE
jgi:hypothetical protein